MIAFLGGAWAAVFVWTLQEFIQRRQLEEKIEATLRSKSGNRGDWIARFVRVWAVATGQASKNRRQRRAHLPDFLDLLALGLSAGQTLDGAWSLALEHLPESSFTHELKSAQHTWRMGRPRGEAIKELRDRLRDPSITMVFSLIEQALTRGGALQDVLRSQARGMRRLQFLAVEKRAQTVGLRLLFPIFVFIFPTVFLILFAPLLIRLSQGLSLF